MLWRCYRSSASRGRHGREIVLWKDTRNRYFFGCNIPLALLPVAVVSVSSAQIIFVCIKVYKPSLALLNRFLSNEGPPLWSSGQSFWLQIQRSRVRFPALPDFLSSSGSGTGSTQPREVN